MLPLDCFTTPPLWGQGAVRNDISKDAGRLQKKQLSQLLSVSVSATHYAVRWEAGVWTEPETTVMARLKGSRVLIRMSERVFFNKNTRKGFYLFEQQCLNMRSFRIIGKFLIPTGTQALLEWDSDTDSNWDNKQNGKDEKDREEQDKKS